MSPCDNPDPRVGGARLLHDLPCLECFRYRNQQIPGGTEIGRFQDIGTCGIANDGLEVALSKSCNDMVRILDDEEGLAAPLQGIGHDAARPTMADEFAGAPTQPHALRGGNRVNASDSLAPRGQSFPRGGSGRCGVSKWHNFSYVVFPTSVALRIGGLTEGSLLHDNHDVCGAATASQINPSGEKT